MCMEELSPFGFCCPCLRALQSRVCEMPASRAPAWERVRLFGNATLKSDDYWINVHDHLCSVRLYRSLWFKKHQSNRAASNLRTIFVHTRDTRTQRVWLPGASQRLEHWSQRCTQAPDISIRVGDCRRNHTTTNNCICRACTLEPNVRAGTGLPPLLVQYDFVRTHA